MDQVGQYYPDSGCSQVSFRCGLQPDLPSVSIVSAVQNIPVLNIACLAGFRMYSPGQPAL